MPITPEELKPFEFNEGLSPVFRAVEAELGRSNGNPAFFFPHWRRLMEMGAARTWKAPGAVLGAIFYADTFTGAPKAVVHFLFLLPDTRGSGTADALLDAFEAAAPDREKSISAHAKITTDRARGLYKRRGYSLSEEIWSKV